MRDVALGCIPKQRNEELVRLAAEQGLSLTGPGEISAHFLQIHGARVTKKTLSRTTDKVAEEMATWSNRPLHGVYVAIFIDTIVVKNRGVTDTFFLVCDGLKGVPEVVSNVCPLTAVRTCIIHLTQPGWRWKS